MGTDEGLTGREAAMARWARAASREPNATTQSDVDALGTQPDAELRRFAPPEVLAVVERPADRRCTVS